MTDIVKNNRQKFTTSAGNQVSFELRGKGRPLLCLSGFGCDSYNYQLLSPLLEESFQLILIDNRGMGASEKTTEEYEILDLAIDALELMKHLSHQRFIVAGISMGGFIAQLIALIEPKRVSKLILMCTSSGGENFKALPEINEQDLINSNKLDLNTRTKIAVENTVHPNLNKKSPEVFKLILQKRKEHPEETEQLILQNRAAKKFLSKELKLDNINCPTLILHGQDDRFVPLDNAKTLMSEIKNSNLITIDESDHFFFMEKSNLVASHINEFGVSP